MNRSLTYPNTLDLFAAGIGSLLLLIFTILPASGQSLSRVGEYQISGPYHHGALTLFLIHGKSTPHTTPFLTLEEALEQNLVTVYETGQVNELAIENRSPDHEIFIQAGEIVKGGRQDRTLGIDLTLAPNSGKLPIASFCVEQGRWSKRGEELDGTFSSSNMMVTSNNLRLAVRKGKDQSKVWSEVSVMQEKLSSTIGVQVAAVGSVNNIEATRNGELQGGFVVEENAVATESIASSLIIPENAQQLSANINIQQLINPPADQMAEQEALLQMGHLTANRVIEQDVIFQDISSLPANSNGYSTSLQLSLENEKLAQEIDAYIEALKEVIAGHGDVIGVAFTINGEMKNADIYASSELFGRLWPKLLRAAATEAVAEKKEGEEIIGQLDVVERCLTDANSAEGDEEVVNYRIKVVTRESDEHILFETQDNHYKNGWVHRNYMKLE